MLTAQHTDKQATISRTTDTPFFGGITMPFFQPKLTVNQPGDAYEQEADAVADQVMRMPDGEVPIIQQMPFTPLPSVQRACAACEHEDKDIQRQTTGGDASGQSAPPIVSNVLRSGGGQQIDTGTRGFMESRFGQDFSHVRIHTDSQAAESASSIQAKAYTSGKDIVFGSGEYQPDSDAGKRLLAHELVHVGQQGASKTIQTKSITSQPATPLLVAPPAIQRQQSPVATNPAIASEYSAPQSRGEGGRRATLPQSATNNIELIRYLCSCRLSSATQESLTGRLRPNPGFTYRYCRGRLTATIGGDVVPQTLTSGTARVGGGINIAPEAGSPGLQAGVGLTGSNTGSEPIVGGQGSVVIGDEETNLDLTGGANYGTNTGNWGTNAGAGLNIGGLRFGLDLTNFHDPSNIGGMLTIGPARRGPARDTCRECHCPVVYTCLDDTPPRTYSEDITETINERTPLRYYFRVGTTRDTPDQELRQMSRQMLADVKSRVDNGAQITSIIGYASPEWRSQNTGDGGRSNLELSGRRAQKLRELLLRNGIQASQLPSFSNEEMRNRSESGGELMGNSPSHWRSDSRLSEAIFASGFGPEEFDLFLFGDDYDDAELNNQFLDLLDVITDPAQRLQFFGIAASDPAAEPLLAELEQFTATRGPVWRRIFNYLRFATVTLTQSRQVTRTETRQTTGSIQELSQERCRPYAQQAESQGLFGPIAPAPVSETACRNEPVQNDPSVGNLCATD